MKKTFVIAVIVFLAFCVGAEVYVQSDMFAHRIRPHVLGPLKQILGDNAQIGWVRANLVPPYVEARDIRLPDEAGRTVASVRKIKVYINPLPLLIRKIRLPSIVILEPMLHIERTKDAGYSITPVIDRIRSHIRRIPRRGSSGFRVSLRNLTVNQGGVSFTDDMTGTSVSVSGLHATARISAAGDITSMAIRNTDIRLGASAYPELAGKLHGTARYDHGRLNIETLELSSADTTVSLSGTAGPFPDPVLDIRVQVRSGPRTIGNFTGILDFFKKERRFFIEATAAVKGKVSDPSLDGVFRLARISYKGFDLHDTAVNFAYKNNKLFIESGKWKISKGQKSILVDGINAELSRNQQGLDIRHFGIKAGDLSLALSGRADAKSGFHSLLAVESSGEGQTLSFLTSVPIEGAVRIKGHLTGALNNPDFDGALWADSVKIRGISFDNAMGGVQYREKSFRLASVNIHQKTGRYVFGGSVDFEQKPPVYTARLKVIRSDVGSIVALFYKKLPLYFAATGDLSFKGTARDFSGSGALSVDSGSAYGEKFSKGTVTATLSKERISFPFVSIEKGSGTVTGSGWIGFNRTYSASVSSSGVRLEEVDLVAGFPARGEFNLSVSSAGSFSRPQVAASLKMEDLILYQASLGGANADLHLGDGQLAVSARLVNSRAAVRAGLGLSKPYVWNAQATVNGDELDPFQLFGKKNLQGIVRVVTSGRVSISGKGRDIASLAGTASFNPLQMIIGNYRIESPGAVLSLSGDRLTIASLQLNGDGTSISVAGGARLAKDLDLSVAGAGNLSILRPLFSELEHADGTAEVKLTISDNWMSPDVVGELAVRDGEFKIRDMDQKFYSLNGKARFDRNSVVVENLTGEIGGGVLNASGKAGFSNFKLQDFSSRVAFENVTLRYPESLVSTLSGELYYDGDTSEQAVTGDVRIKRARYDKRIEWKSMLVNVVKGLHQKKKTRSALIGNTLMNIRLYGNENILFKNNLAEMPLEVDLFLRGTMGRPQLLGRIDARKGSVYFKRNEFKVLHAAVDFIDPNRVNPVLDVQAEIQVREYKVSLSVSGTAEQAVVTLFSDPSLSDSDILSLLALGKTGSELTGTDAGVEAASLATGQFQDFFESRARSLTGLDRFQVDPYVNEANTSVPRVTVGKEIVQGKLYMMYSSNVGSTTPEQIFRIEYILNKHFSLVGERNEIGNTGADIKYRFEFK